MIHRLPKSDGQEPKPVKQPGKTLPRMLGDGMSLPTPLLQRFRKQRPHYKDLGIAIRDSLKELLKVTLIKVVKVTSRPKTLTSFIEKLARKSYRNPFRQITDFAGVRVVCFYEDDIPRIESVIYKQFRVIEKVVRPQEVDRFGYSGIHYIVRLRNTASGSRSDNLRRKKCEIQVRTILQDAWAIFSQLLMYKHEDEIPDVLRREIHAVAGALALADTVYKVIRDRRNSYIASVMTSTKAKALSTIRTNLDSLATYLTQEFPDRPAPAMAYLRQRMYQLDRQQYPTIEHVSRLLQRTRVARRWYHKRISPKTPQGSVSSAIELFRALGIMHAKVRNRWKTQGRTDPIKRDLLKRAHAFVKPRAPTTKEKAVSQ